MSAAASLDPTARYADMLSAMGAEPRLRILRLLLRAHPRGLVVGEIQSELDIAGSTLSHHLEKLKHEGLITVRRESTFLRYRADTGALRELVDFLYAECCTRRGCGPEPALVALEPGPAGRPTVLVLCTGNSARSQMAAGFLRSFDSRLEVHSAGTHPAARVNPFAVEAMREIGIDISAARPRNVAKFLRQPVDWLITVCGEADRSCPVFRGEVGKRLHIGFPDPAAVTGTDRRKLAAFRKVRDDIGRRFREFYETEIQKGK